MTVVATTTFVDMEPGEGVAPEGFDTFKWTSDFRSLLRGDLLSNSTCGVS
jgi:hypothetical protein